MILPVDAMSGDRTVAVVLGGGVGNRFGAAMPKQLLTLGGKTLVEHCVTAFATAPGVDEVLLVMPPGFADEAAKLAGNQVSTVITGGVTRSDSVRNALVHLMLRNAPETTGVLLHDAARPLVSQRIIADCVAALKRPRRGGNRRAHLRHDRGRRGWRDVPRPAAGDPVPLPDPAMLPPVGHRQSA